jgi:hypothetical protein
MMEKTMPVSQREGYIPTRWTRFLWWLSTADADLLKDCVVDRGRYAITGMTVLGTWLFASLAWTYFFSTVVNNIWAAILLGLFMGGIILSIDRALIKGINRANKKRFIPLAFRAVLALTIGLFMAQPALLYLFDKEIHVQISLDNEQRKKEKRMEQDAVYAAERLPLVQKRNELQKELTARYQEVSVARDNFIKETDGTGGSKKPGLKDIAEAKQREYLKLDADYRQKEKLISPQLAVMDSSLSLIDQAIRKEQAWFETLLNDGFITRIEALNHLVKDNTAVAFRYYLLVAILLLIELMPVIAKSLLPAGSYDEKIVLQEEKEITLVRQNHTNELSLKQLYNQTAYEQDAGLIRHFFDESSEKRKEKIKENIGHWNRQDSGQFTAVWDDMKQEILTKSES